MKKTLQLIIILTSILSFSQNKLTGKITTVDNIPLQNAVIHITENNAFTETDAFGKYTFENVPKGEITLIVNLLGYEQKTEKINSTNQTELNFILNEKEQHLDEVLVSTTFNKVQSQSIMKVEHKTID
jgi:iron complex outermembrane recepter protein